MTDACNLEFLSYVKQAIRKRDATVVILHSDHGSIYTSKEFQMYAKENGITTSISRKETAMIMP
ncbi:DDE-type integrase/transposase/recombinase [Bacillus sp. OTU530]|uniref:DDE-type integrase/transposase/recombinase n=1 Tax=Bacillus sp. OTU530 TaxID=3043862 RepID=UPI00406C4CB1